jgi:hypothetical protein
MVRAAVGIGDATARRGERHWFKDEVRKSQGGDSICRMRGTDRKQQAGRHRPRWRQVISRNANSARATHRRRHVS